jgi:hypothetical protein
VLYSGKFGRSVVSDEFNQMCVDFHVEATVQPFPNPGNLTSTPRMITFRSFAAETLKVVRKDKVDLIPAKGTVQLMLQADEPLPKLERIE